MHLLVHPRSLTASEASWLRSAQVLAQDLTLHVSPTHLVLTVTPGGCCRSPRVWVGKRRQRKLPDLLTGPGSHLGSFAPEPLPALGHRARQQPGLRWPALAATLCTQHAGEGSSHQQEPLCEDSPGARGARCAGGGLSHHLCDLRAGGRDGVRGTVRSHGGSGLTVRSHGGSGLAGGEPCRRRAGWPCRPHSSGETDRSSGLQSASPAKSDQRKDRLFHCGCRCSDELLATETAMHSEKHVQPRETRGSHVAFGRKRAMGLDVAPLQAEGLGRLSLRVNKAIPAAQRGSGHLRWPGTV